MTCARLKLTWNLKSAKSETHDNLWNNIHYFIDESKSLKGCFKGILIYLHPVHPIRGQVRHTLWRSCHISFFSLTQYSQLHYDLIYVFTIHVASTIARTSAQHHSYPNALKVSEWGSPCRLILYYKSLKYSTFKMAHAFAQVMIYPSIYKAHNASAGTIRL